MTSLFRASNLLGLENEGDLTEVSFNVSMFELLINGWSWQDLNHFSAHRVLCFQDGSIVLQTEHMKDLLQASIHNIRGLFCFSWTQLDTDFPREVMLCIQPSTVTMTTGNYEIAETFSGILAMFSRSSLPINLTVRCLINDPAAAHLPMFAIDEALRHVRPQNGQDNVLESNLRKVAFHSMTFEGRTYRNLTDYLQGVDQLDLDSIVFDDDDWLDFVLYLQNLPSLRILRLLHSHRPSRRQSPEITHQRSLPLIDLVSGSRIEVLSLCRQHRDRNLYPLIQRQLKVNLIRKWHGRSQNLAETYKIDGYTPPLAAALARVSHDVDLTLGMVTANARALSYCTPLSLAQERATMEADRRELEALMARVFRRSRGKGNEVNSGHDGFGIDEKGEIGSTAPRADEHLMAPQSTLDSKELFYSIARDILGDD